MLFTSFYILTLLTIALASFDLQMSMEAKCGAELSSGDHVQCNIQRELADGHEGTTITIDSDSSVTDIAEMFESCACLAKWQMPSFNMHHEDQQLFGDAPVVGGTCGADAIIYDVARRRLTQRTIHDGEKCMTIPPGNVGNSVDVLTLPQGCVLFLYSRSNCGGTGYRILRTGKNLAFNMDIWSYKVQAQ